MLNVAIALSTFLSMVIFFAFRSTLPFHDFALLVGIVYLLVRFSPARRYLQPDNANHILFVCSYLMIGIPFWIFKVKGPSNGFSLLIIWETAFLGSIIIIGFVLLTIGVSVLLTRAINRFIKLKKSSK